MNKKGIATKRHKIHKMISFLCLLCLFVAIPSYALDRSFLIQYCVTCHNE